MAGHVSGRIGRELLRLARRPAAPSAFRLSERSVPGVRRLASRAQPPNPRYRSLPALAAGGGLLTVLFSVALPVSYAQAQIEGHPDADAIAEDKLPCYRLTEIREHGPGSARPWVMYEDKIYDITDWIPAHPGGEVILRAAGRSIEPYWNIFAIHKTPYVREILEQYVVGHVHPDDLVDGRPRMDRIEDPFVEDPERDPRLRQLTAKPCNAETAGDDLAGGFLTPNEVFYVRNHMWVPVIDEDSGDSHAISIELPDGSTRTYTVGDLKTRFRQHAVTAVLQCSGNRRKDMTKHAKKTNGLQWGAGAISCARWEGVRLRDVLADAGLAVESPPTDAQHVQFSGLEAYGASIPIRAALDPRGDVLLAFRMNDMPLPRDHGFPVRVVVPGTVAARCVKWVNKIVISDEESTTSWQRRDYKCFGPNELTNLDWDKYKSIQEMPVTSAITRARLRERGAQAPADNVVELEGYAYSGGGREIQRVDVSLDGGKTWDQARLLDDAHQEAGSKTWCWKRWMYEGALPSVEGGQTRTTFVVKATDEVYNTQPQCYKTIYNPRGNLSTAWHRVEMDIPPPSHTRMEKGPQPV
jgi:sulfite oxidase